MIKSKIHAGLVRTLFDSFLGETAEVSTGGGGGGGGGRGGSSSNFGGFLSSIIGRNR